MGCFGPFSFHQSIECDILVMMIKISHSVNIQSTVISVVWAELQSGLFCLHGMILQLMSASLGPHRDFVLCNLFHIKCFSQ